MNYCLLNLKVFFLLTLHKWFQFQVSVSYLKTPLHTPSIKATYTYKKRNYRETKYQIHEQGKLNGKMHGGEFLKEEVSQ